MQFAIASLLSLVFATTLLASQVPRNRAESLSLSRLPEGWGSVGSHIFPPHRPTYTTNFPLRSFYYQYQQQYPCKRKRSKSLPQILGTIHEREPLDGPLPEEIKALMLKLKTMIQQKPGLQLKDLLEELKLVESVEVSDRVVIKKTFIVMYWDLQFQLGILAANNLSKESQNVGLTKERKRMLERMEYKEEEEAKLLVQQIVDELIRIIVIPPGEGWDLSEATDDLDVTLPDNDKHREFVSIAAFRTFSRIIPC